MVILHLGIGEYFALDVIGSIVWEQVSSGKTTDEVVAFLISEFAVDEQTARSDVERLTGELLALGLLERRA